MAADWLTKVAEEHGWLAGWLAGWEGVGAGLQRIDLGYSKDTQ